MDTLASSTGLDKNKNGSADDRDEVQRQVHKVTNDCLWAELCERTLECLSQPLDWVAAGLDLSTPLYKFALVSGKQSAIKGFQDGILQQIISRDHVDNRGTLVENQEDGGKDREWAIDEDEDGELRQVCECKHAPQHTAIEGNVLRKL